MKRKSYFSLTIIIAAAVLLNCGIVALADAKKPEVKVKFYVGTPYGAKNCAGYRWLAENKVFEKRTDGRVGFEFYPGGEILKGNDITIAAQKGDASFIEVAFYHQTLEPRIKLFDMPMLFEDMNHYRAWRLTDDSKAMWASLEKMGFMGPGRGPLMWYGDMTLYNSKKPIHTRADLKGLKIRIIPTPTFTKLAKVLGAEAVAIDMAEFIPAIETKVVDGVITNQNGQSSWNLKKRSPYMMYEKLYPSFSELGISVAWWKTVPEDLKPTIWEVLEEALAIGYRSMANTVFETWDEARKTPGVVITQFSREEREQIREECKSKLWAPLAKEITKKCGVDGQAIIDRIREMPEAQ